MRSIYFASTSRTYIDIYFSILLSWVIDNFIITVRSLCNLEAFASYGNLLLKWTDDSKKSDVENTDDDRTDEYTAPCKRRRSEHTDGFGDQGMNDDEWQHEDEDNTAGQQEGAGYSDNGDDDDNDDDDSGSDDHDENHQEEEEEEEESDDTKSFKEDIDTDSLLVHAREVYASNYFRIFEREYRKSMAIDIDGPVDGDMIFEYEVHRSRVPNTPSLYDKLYGYADSTDIDYIFTPLLKHAKDIYIPEIYNLFREEYRRSEFLSPHSVHDDLNERGLIVVYEVDAPHRPENYMVYSEPAKGTVNCTCQKFASACILCSHALLVLYVMDIVKIPPQYINPSHLKDCYDVGNDNNGKIHGTRYARFESYARWRVKEKRSKMMLKLAYDCKAVGFDPDYLDSCLGELSKGQSIGKEEGGGGGASAKSQKSEIMFWDDQGIRSFTYKKPVMTRKLCIQWRFSSRQSP